MSTYFDLQNLQILLREFLAPFGSGALINQEQQVLGLKYESISEIGTFGPLAQNVGKYFQLEPGDYVLANDPYSGGTLLTVFSLVTCFRLGDQKFYFIARTRFRPLLTLAKKLDEEGVRVPPTPVAHGAKFNEMLLDAIASHPLAPAEFKATLQKLLDKMELQIQTLQAWAKVSPNCLSKNQQKLLFQETKSRLISKLSELPHGDISREIQFEDGEVIRLNLEIKTSEIQIDFAGTSGSQRVFLTDMATFGTCLGSLLAFLKEELLLNEGVFSIIHVTTPQGCFLNAKYPAPFFEGTSEPTFVLANAIFDCLSEITSTVSVGMNGAVPTVLSFEFSKDQVLFEGLPGGTGANSERNGLDAYLFWNLGKYQTSVEEIESSMPILVRQSGVRQSSGGKGRFNGGNGILREIELQQDCRMKWLLGLRNTQTKGLKHALPGSSPEIKIIRYSGEKQELTQSKGTIDLKVGDKIVVGSAGGGGFGKI